MRHVHEQKQKFKLRIIGTQQKKERKLKRVLMRRRVPGVARYPGEKVDDEQDR